jgi:outer membrane protein
MKTTGSTLTKITLGLLVAASIVACNNKPAATPVTATTTTTADKGTTAYINSDTLLSKYEYAKDMNKRLEDKGKVSKAEVTKQRQQAFQREVAEYQKSQLLHYLPTSARPPSNALQRKQQELQGYQQNATAEFQNRAGYRKH